jgi:ABC-2 type transport system ATP-binding protein
LNLTIEPDQIHGLVGLNGSGKTTLFNSIYGFIKSRKGSICWNEQPLLRGDVAFLETQNYFYSNITGREYLQLFTTENSSFDLEIWQNLFKLPLDDLIENYSTGMKKKLAILGVLKLDKPIILLDEPFNGIDIETGRIIKVLLEKLKQRNKTIIVSSHILETLTNTCDYIHYLENKKIKATYDKGSLKNIEQDIFKELEKRTSELIDKAI